MNKADSPDDRIETWRKDVSALSYEEALQALDLLMNKLQSESIPLAELQNQYLHAQVYLNHCEAMLRTVEQAVTELDPDSLNPSPNA